MEYWIFLAPHKRLPETPWYFKRHPTQAPQLEKTHEMPPSSRGEGLLFLPGLESNHDSSLKSEEEAGLP